MNLNVSWNMNKTGIEMITMFLVLGSIGFGTCWKLLGPLGSSSHLRGSGEGGKEKPSRRMWDLEPKLAQGLRFTTDMFHTKVRPYPTNLTPL